MRAFLGKIHPTAQTLSAVFLGALGLLVAYKRMTDVEYGAWAVFVATLVGFFQPIPKQKP